MDQVRKNGIKLNMLNQLNIAEIKDREEGVLVIGLAGGGKCLLN